MPEFDAQLMFRTAGSGALAANASFGPLVVYGGIREGLAARVAIPSANGINDTIYPKVYISQDGTNYNLAAQYAKGAVKPGAGSLDMIVPFPVLPGKNYVKLELIGAAASTTYNFGVVQAGIVQNPGFDWDRSTAPGFF
jgi:hypothetical protein